MRHKRRWAAMALVLVSIGLPGLSLAATLNVPKDFPTIQACIDAAVSGVDECVVAPGTYHETINFLNKGITLRSSGGAEVTTINATGLGGSVVTCATGESPDTVLAGFTITGGTGTILGGFTYGGGMFNYYSSPTVTNCTFNGNRSTGGGGMYNYDEGNPSVTNCTFRGNGATAVGGGMLNNMNSRPTVTNCTFTGNTASQGGGMYNSDSSPLVSHCTFSGNTGNAGGGLTNDRSSSIVTNCTFSGNGADLGGGMYNSYGGHPTVTNCTFMGNTGRTYGGGMHNYQSSPTVNNCTFIGNRGSYGGGMHSFISNAMVSKCTFSGNTATGGGGIYNYSSRPEVTNCVFWGDSPNEAVNTNLSTITFRFSDVQGGVPVGAIDGGSNFDLDPMFMRPPDPGLDGTWDGVDDDYGDLRLRVGSPCIDAGDPGYVAQLGETDLDGHARVLCGQVDMGAYEFGIGDYDCNQTMDLIDFANWSACMTGPQGGPYDVGCEAFDFDGDGDVDLGDLASWQNAFNGS